MSLSLNNSKDLICDSLYLIYNNNLENILNVIGSGGGGSGITTLTGTGSAIITGVGSSRNILVDLSNYSTTTQINSLLNSKQNTLTAGSNITILNNTISSTGGSSLILEVDGVTQSATTLNFIQNNSSLVNGVLNVSRLTHYDKIPLMYGVIADIKDITQGSQGELKWNGVNLITDTDMTGYSTTTQMNTALANYIPITHESNKISNANVGFGAFDINTQTLTLQNSSGVQGLLTVDNGGNLKINNSGVVTVAYLNAKVYDTIDLKDSSNVVRTLLPSITGSLTYDGVALVDLNYLTSQLASKVNNTQVLTNVPANALFTDTLYTHPTQHSISMITNLQNELDAKQPMLTAGSNITISNNIISSSSSSGGSSYSAGSGINIDSNNIISSLFKPTGVVAGT